ncbi:hypothetical protein [Acinetobacter baumannii]|uniref:hypothetical protein n=1 Tax=Acinetobacter baumannii TaxID=470 RepID=UPI00366FBC33
MGTMTSVTIIGISLIIIALAVWLLERKYTKSGILLKATTDRITVLESTVTSQGNAIAAATSKVDVIGSEQTKDRIKIGELQASKLPLRESNTTTHVTPPVPLPSTQNDPAVTLLTTAAIVSTFDSTPSYSSGSCSSSSDSGSSHDSSSSCSSSSDSY